MEPWGSRFFGRALAALKTTALSRMRGGTRKARESTWSETGARDGADGGYGLRYARAHAIWDCGCRIVGGVCGDAESEIADEIMASGCYDQFPARSKFSAVN